MAIQKLSARAVATATPGKYSDGAGLWLEVKPNGSRRWFFRCTIDGKRREPGLGTYPDVALALARKKAAALRALVAQGLDPLNLPPDPERVVVPTFVEAAARYIRTNRRGWSNLKHARQWAATLRTYAKPILGHLPVDQIDTPHILQVLTPIWQKKTETAKRVQGRIENILDWASAHKYRTGPNPAAWRGNLAQILPRPAKVATVRHQPALPWGEMPDFMRDLARSGSISALALEFLIRTTTRTQEVLGATWAEINLDTAIWHIGASRMKARRAHDIPLTAACLALLAKVPRLPGNPYVFPGSRPGRSLSNMALLQVMRGMGHGVNGERSASVVHGFRSSFRDWAGETTPHPRDVVEMQLAHVIENQTEAAYRRGNMLTKRLKLLEDWNTYLDRPAAKIVPIRPATQATASAS
jgi:integrase